MNKLQKITANVQADKELMKLINSNSYTSVESFIENAKRYIDAIRTGKMICNIASVSNSGMSRNIKFLAPEFNKARKMYQYCNFYTLFKHLGFTENKKTGEFRISGCGMDMIFHTNYTIIHKLHRLGFIDKKVCAKLAQMTPTVI
jgi:hypothetical protein